MRAATRQATTISVGITPLLAAAAFLVMPQTAHPDTSNGLTVADEDRCSPYDRADYPYPQSVEAQIVASQGGRIYGPYTGTTFRSTRETDIEHIVAASEAHDSGLCAAGARTRARFATDLLNLTLASPEVNRCDPGGKCGYDAGQWLPRFNQCWFAARVVAVKRKYRLSVDPREAAALDRVLAGCTSDRMIVHDASRAQPRPRVRTAPATGDALALYDDNENGRITCAEARRHGIAPVPRSHPAYRFMRDGDGDGVVCE